MMDGSIEAQGRVVDIVDGAARPHRVRLYAAIGGEGRDIILIEDETQASFRLVPREDLSVVGPDRVRLSRPLSDYKQVERPAEGSEKSETSEKSEKMVVPVIEETVSVERHPRTTARVHVHKWTEREPVQLDELLTREQVEVEHFLIDRPLRPGEEVKVRLEGDTLVIPVVEERLVVEKQLVLREEVHVTRRRHQRRETGTVELRRVRVDINRKTVDDERHAAGE